MFSKNNRSCSTLKIFLVILIACLLCNPTIPALASTKYILTTIGNSASGSSEEGVSANNALIQPGFGITIDKKNNVYFSEGDCIKKIDEQGIISTMVGGGNNNFVGDGVSAKGASFENIVGIAADNYGNIYFADSSRNMIYKVDTSTGLIAIVAGIGSQGFSGDNGPARVASLCDPEWITLDNEGNIYICDNGNNRIRKVDKTTGVITTIAGNGILGHSGDGDLAIKASLFNPSGIAIDNNGIYFSDTSAIRKIDIKSGIITKCANVKACAMVLDNNGNAYVTDINNNVIRKVDLSSGNNVAIAALGNTNEIGQDHILRSTYLNNPFGITLDSIGNLYITSKTPGLIKINITNDNSSSYLIPVLIVILFIVIVISIVIIKRNKNKKYNLTTKSFK